MPNDILTRAIDELCAGSHLTADHTSAALAEIMEGRVAEVQIAAFLIALRAKGETVPELVGLARTMRALAAEVTVNLHGLVDTAGTGGGPTTFNVSTTAALIAAGAGCKVAKHGNRSATSRSGSADVLEALGVAIELAPEQVATCIDEVGFGFMFAPKHHKATAHVVPVRKELAVRTIFNFLGPLTNPAGAERQLLGVSDRNFQETIAEALIGLGCEHALVVSADNGMDELALGRTRVVEVVGGRTEEWFAEPEDFGLRGAPIEDIAGGSPEENADVVKRVFAGGQGPAHDISVLNGGAAIFVAGGADSLAAGVERAKEAVASGAAADVLERLASKTTELAEASAVEG
ncbi:MAG: anthranilate phosphoribosyltransferase [Solirubrobacterales bacterium]|nr:anthranilate phosphoribosyltransferase [Solirubrobacterales bacterium]